MQNQPNMSTGSTGMNSVMSAAMWQNILNRIKLVLTDPKGCWSTIKSEPGDIKSIYMNWILPVTGFYFLAQFIGMQLWGYTVLGMTYRPGFGSSLTQGIVGFVMQSVGFFVCAQILSFLAPKFEGKASPESALKLLGYTFSATAVSGILFLIPIPFKTVIMLVLGLYSLYIMWCGLDMMMGVSAAKKIPYAVVSIVCCMIVMFVVNMIVATMSGASDIGAMSTSGEKIELPGGVTIDPEQMQKATEQMQKMFPQQGN